MPLPGGVPQLRSEEPRPLRVVIAEVAAIMRDGLTQTLSRRGHQVVAAVGDGDSLLRAVSEQHPDVAVINGRKPPTHRDAGLQAAHTIKPDHPGVGVLRASATCCR